MFSYIKTQATYNYYQLYHWWYKNSGSFFHICKSGNPDIIKKMIQNNRYNWNEGLEGACFGGNIEVVHLMIQKGSRSFDTALFAACLDDQIISAQLMIENGANVGIGIMGLSSNSNADLLKLLIENGASHIPFEGVAIRQQMLNLGLDIKLIPPDDQACHQIIQQRYDLIEIVTPTIDAILYELYKTKQMYDKNVIKLITAYIMY